MGYPRAVAPGVDRLPCARVSGCTACLGAALHPRLGKRAGLFGQHVGSEKVCQHPPGALGSYKIWPAAAGSADPEGPQGWRRLAGARRRASAPQALGCWVSARESDSRARGATALLTASGSSRCFQGSLHHHFTAEVSPCPRWGRQDTARRPKGCGQRTFRWRCRQAKARDASISRWCCGPRHLKPGCLRVPGS